MGFCKVCRLSNSNRVHHKKYRADYHEYVEPPEEPEEPTLEERVKALEDRLKAIEETTLKGERKMAKISYLLKGEPHEPD